MRQRGTLPGPVFVAMATIVLVAGCAPASSATPPSGESTGSSVAAAPQARPRELQDVIVAVVVQSTTQLPFYVGLKSGIFEEEGLRVTVTQMPIPTMLAGIVEG